MRVWSPSPPGGGVEIPSQLVLQVSNALAISYTYSTDTGKVDYAYLSLFLADIDSSLREGVKIAIFAILPKRSAQSFRPLGNVF